MDARLHLSPLVELLASFAMIVIGPTDFVGPPRGLYVTNDGVSCAEWRQPAEVTLRLTTKGVHALGAQTPRRPEEALARTRAEHPTARSLGLRIDDDVDVQQLVSFIDRCRAAGFDDVRLAPR